MKAITTLPEAMDCLLSYRPVDMKGNYTLERMTHLMHVLGDPQESFKSIHVAGTSGKTSTAYFIRGLLEAAGRKTGLTVSPHIVSITERVQIGGAPIQDRLFLQYLNRYLPLVETSGIKPTYFELLIGLAYWVFAQEKVAYAVIETGLGGLLDGTNVIRRPDKICVITDIGLDHTEILGDTLPLIAAQKAGIIQPYNHVLLRLQPAEVMQVFQTKVTESVATMHIIDVDDRPTQLPAFQWGNWALARSTYEYVASRDGLAELNSSTVRRVMQETPPGRGEFYRINGKTVILDGAHNPQKLEALVVSLTGQGIKSAAVLANFVESPDSKLQQSVDLLKPFASHWIIPTFSAGQDLKSRRSFTSATTAAVISHEKAIMVDDPLEAVERLLQSSESTLLITGSLYLVSLLRPYILDLQSK